MSDDFEKKFYQAQYRASLVEAELNAVRSSKAYKITKGAGIIKNQLKSDPVGLSKKAARMLLNNPKKLLHFMRTADRVGFMAQSVVDQNNKYQEWILLNEPDATALQQQRVEVDTFKNKPLISVITPVFNPPIDVLEELIESVLNQTYPHFELFLGNFGDKPEVKELIEKYAKLDPRVVHTEFKNNDGIANNSNQILAKVKGDYIALLDHDDTLSLDALYENAKLINEADYDFIYSDKDKIDLKGNRFDPLFKPKLSPEMLLNINYLTHLNVMKTSIVKSIGGWDSATDGAQDWDLFLRVIIEANLVGHIPKVLYHWRVIESSTAMSIETKPYALAGQRKSVDKHLEAINIKAESYHQKTEMFIKWDEQSINRKPVVYIYYSSFANTIKTIRYVRKVTDEPNFVVLIDSHNLKNIDEKQLKQYYKNTTVVVYNPNDVFTAIKGTIKNDANYSLFIKDTIHFPKSDWYADLAGWLNIEDVVASSGRLIDNRDLIVDSGAMISKNGEYVPLFQGYPRFYQSYLGNAEWVRDLSILSSNFFIAKNKSLAEFMKTDKKGDNPYFDNYFLWASLKDKRLVLTPHVTGTIHGDLGSNVKHSLNLPKGYVDVYSNPNTSNEDPLRLFSDEADHLNKQTAQTIEAYQHDAIILANTFDITEEEITKNIEQLKNSKKGSVYSVAWVLPAYEAVYAGMMNIFGFANFLLNEKKLDTTFYILKSTKDVAVEKREAIKAFPMLKSAKFVSILPDDSSAMKQHDIGIATQWATAYTLAKSDAISRKWYFIQDNEVNFYPKGSISSLVELSYRFGFKAIANTDGLLDMYQKNYGGEGVVVKSRVDLSAYIPREDIHYVPKAPYKVFFYARPNMPRNAFELGVAGLKKLKDQLGDSVEIITAGADWDADIYGAGGYFTNLGKINYEAVPKLYRSVDAGLMFMFSGHPGVTASELMASGCPVVVNEYDDITWSELYKNEETCLVTKSTASEVARNLRRCLEDTDLRKKLIKNGLKKTQDFYGGYEESCNIGFEQLLK